MQKRKLHKRYIVVLLVSLLLHLLIFPINIKYSDINKKNPGLTRTKVKLQINNLDKSKAKQIVNSEDNAKKEKDENAKFLGKTDKKFDRQTIAKKVGIFNQAGKGNSSIDRQENKNSDSSGEKKIVKKNGLSLAALALGKGQIKKSIKNQKRMAAKKGLKFGSENHKGLPQNNDYVEDVPLGDMTNLNTIEYKYYGFYHRIRQKLEQHWGSSLREKAVELQKQGRFIGRGVSKITSLSVFLDARGNIKRIHIKNASGVEELDEAAVESFNRAGPFPNPPKGLLNNGTAKIEWGFVVKG